MKVLHIVEGFGGGVYSFLRDLCNNSCDEFEIILVYTERAQTPENFQKEFNKNVKLIKVQMARDINLIKDTRALFSLLRLIKSESPDIIHLHSSKVGFLGRIACFLLGINSDRVFYNPHGFAFLQQNISPKKQKLYFLLEKVAAKVSGSIIAVSKGEAREALKLTNKVYRIDNAINPDSMDVILKKGTDRNRDIVIGTIGRISYQKNPKLFNLIAKEFPNIKFLWIGDGELRQELNCPNISITGWKLREDAIYAMQDIDIYIQTSLWEGLPIALLEAMYLSKPIVANDVIGNNDVVIDGYNGFLCRDINDFINAINKLIQDENLLKKMMTNSRRYVTSKHLLKEMITKYKDIYLGVGKYVTRKEL